MKEILDLYIEAQDKYRKAKHELREAETKLEMECRRISCLSSPIDKNLKKMATILLSKLQ